MKKIYIISGLGVNEKVFKRINLSAYEVTFLNWIEPLPNELLNSYARRLSACIQEDSFILVGLSFGGLLAQEICSFKPPEKLILISSFVNYRELAPELRLCLKLKLYKFLPSTWLTKGNLLLYHYFSINQKEEQQVLKEVLSETSPTFVKWAFNVLAAFPAINHYPAHRLHGRLDRIVKSKPEKTIIQNKGGHFGIYTHAAEIQQQLVAIL